MRVAELMRRIDSLVLPPLARALTRIGQAPGRGRMLSGVALVCASVVLVTAVWAAQTRPSGEDAGGTLVAVGVEPGDSAVGYEELARAELAQMRAAASGAATRPYALVSFGAYVAPDRLGAILSGSAVSEVFARVPLSGIRTQIVRIPATRIPEDVVAGMELFAERKDREAVGFQEKANLTADDAERHGYEQRARAAVTEAMAYRSGCSCVYAAVVRAAPEALGELAERPGVRTVDPAPEVRRLDRAVFHPPLPEQLGDEQPFGEASPGPAPEGQPSSPAPLLPVPTEPGPAGPEPTALPTEPTPSPSEDRPPTEPPPDDAEPTSEPSPSAG